MHLFKWAGGKTKMLAALAPYIPEKFDVYHEPYLGGGAMLLHLKPKLALVYDANEWLKKFWIDLLSGVDISKDEFFQSTAWDDVSNAEFLACRDRLNSGTWSIADFLFFNRACFNGLFRVNKSNKINVPRGDTWKINKESILEDVQSTQDWAVGNVWFSENAGTPAGEGHFFFFDPPYHGVFDDYTAGGFSDADRTDLGNRCAKIVEMGGRVLLTDSPSAAEFYRKPGLNHILLSEIMVISGLTSGRGAKPTLVVWG